MSKKTASLFDILESELAKKGINEFYDGEEIVFFNSDFSIMEKILTFNVDVQQIVTDVFFYKQSLKDPIHDEHFKRVFTHRFLNREMNRQTVESFANEVVYTFLTNKDFLNRIYTDMDLYLKGVQQTTTSNAGTTTSDNRNAHAELPQDNVQLDVNSTVMESATENSISRNKQVNSQESTGSSESYNFDTLMKTNGLISQVLDTFDRQCFLQTW